VKWILGLLLELASKYRRSFFYADLAQIVVQSALKTIVLTDLCWSNKLKEIRQIPVLNKGSSSRTLQIKTTQKKDLLYFEASSKSSPKIHFTGTFSNGQITHFYYPISSHITLDSVNSVKKEITQTLQKLKLVLIKHKVKIFNIFC
jgi:hypothetical protein